MLIGYMLVLEADSTAVRDQQRQKLLDAGVAGERIYEDVCHTRQDERIALPVCLEELQAGDTLVVWQLDRLVYSRSHLLELLHALRQQDVGLKVLDGHGAVIDTAHISLKTVIDVIEALSELEATIVGERTAVGLAAARAKGQTLGAQRKMTPAMLRQAMLAMTQSNASATQIAADLGVTRATLYNYLNGDGSLKPTGEKLLAEAE